MDASFDGEAPYEVRKINKRLVIVDQTGRTVYSMPFWVRVSNRDQLLWLCDRFNQSGKYDIISVIDFERRHSTVSR